MKKKHLIKYYIILFIFVIIFWLINLTPINLHDKGSFVKLILLSILIILPRYLLISEKEQNKKGFFFENIQFKFKSWRDLFSRRKRSGLIWIPLILICLYAIFNLSSVEFFRSRSYAKLLSVENMDFPGNISEVHFTDIPTVDRDTAQRLGSKKMGEIAELVSQFEVDPEYTQINYQGRPVRVTPLRYGDIIKWFNNRAAGLPRLIRVDMVDSSVALQEVKGGMKYSFAEPFFHNINRHLRLRYPFSIFDTPVMEINEDGVPFWVAPILKPQIGWFGGRDVTDIVLCNAVTGETTKYKVEDVPTWVDRVYPADLVLKQINYYGAYQDGFINSKIGQKGVLRATALYNYLALDDDVYLYTGITSVSTEDNSNLGFVLVNLRTKETFYYAMASADESSAMKSAEGAVQEKGYVATIPILLNIGGRPSYCMALKDQGSLVKMYALVDAQNYQTTGVGSSIKEAIQNYEISQNSRLRNEPDATDQKTEVSLSAKIKDIQAVSVEGNTYYYFMLDLADQKLDKANSLWRQYLESQVFSAPLALSPQLPFLQADTEIEIDFYSPYREEDMNQDLLEASGKRMIEVNSINIK